MPAPAIKPDVVEQAIFTWSSLNLDGSKGQGFGKISPGLEHSVDWLNSLDRTRFQLSEPASGQDTGRFAGWRALTAVGAFSASGLGVVYRKVADVGQDGHGRERFLVHLLVGLPGELDLARVGEAGAPWLSPEDCPLDALPALSALTLGDLGGRELAHSCAERDASARSLLRRLVMGSGELLIGETEAVTPVSVTGELLTGIPAGLWGQIELDWFAGRTGPLARIHIEPDGPSPTRSAGRAVLADLDGCGLHREVESVWAALAPAARSWEGFAHALASPTYVRAPAPGVAASQTVTGTHREQAAAVIAEILGAPGWSPGRMLSDGEAKLALRALGRLTPPPGGWVTELAADELRALLAGLESPGTFAEACSVLAPAEVPAPQLADAWQHTGLAPLGFALLRRETALADGWALPHVVDGDQLRRLVSQLGTSQEGLDRLACLFRCGFAANTHARGELVRALRAAGVQPRHLFERILPRARLSPALLLEFLRDDVDGFAGWLGVADTYGGALRLGLERRRLFSLRALRLWREGE